MLVWLVMSRVVCVGVRGFGGVGGGLILDRVYCPVKVLKLAYLSRILDVSYN